VEEVKMIEIPISLVYTVAGIVVFLFGLLAGTLISEYLK